MIVIKFLSFKSRITRTSSGSLTKGEGGGSRGPSTFLTYH